MEDPSSSSGQDVSPQIFITRRIEQPRSDDVRYEGVARLLHVHIRTVPFRELRVVEVTDLFKTIAVWDVKTQSIPGRRPPDGKCEVTLEVMAQKLRANGVGVETATPMNDFVGVGFFAPRKNDPLYLTRHRIRTAKQRIPHHRAAGGVARRRRSVPQADRTR
jgi:hypothetical protein